MKEKEEVEENEEEEETVCRRVAIYSPIAKIEAITEKIFEINSRGESRIKKEKEEVKEKKCNNSFISDSDFRFRIGATIPEEEEEEEYS